MALDIIAKAKAKGVNLVLGCDCVAADKFANDANTQVCPDNDIPEGLMGLDAGPKTQGQLKAAIKGAKTNICGTVLQVYSKWITLLLVQKLSQKLSQKQLKKALSL